MEPFLVPDDLYRHRLPGRVIPAVQDLAERAFPKGIYDFVTVCQVVVIDHQVIATVVVVRVVVRSDLQCSLSLVATSASVIHSRELENLFTLILRKILCLTALQNG